MSFLWLKSVVMKALRYISLSIYLHEEIPALKQEINQLKTQLDSLPCRRDAYDNGR